MRRKLVEVGEGAVKKRRVAWVLRNGAGVGSHEHDRRWAGSREEKDVGEDVRSPRLARTTQ